MNENNQEQTTEQPVAQRNPVEVMESIMALAPAEAKTESIISSYEKWKRDVGYCPPELVSREWQKAGLILQDLIGQPPFRDPKDDWKMQALSLYSTAPIEKLREAYGPNSTMKEEEQQG